LLLLLFCLFVFAAVLQLYQALAEELEQKLSACHNQGLDSAEVCQEGDKTPMPEPAKQKPTLGIFPLWDCSLPPTLQPSRDT